MLSLAHLFSLRMGLLLACCERRVSHLLSFLFLLLLLPMILSLLSPLSS